MAYASEHSRAPFKINCKDLHEQLVYLVHLILTKFGCLDQISRTNCSKVIVIQVVRALSVFYILVFVEELRNSLYAFDGHSEGIIFDSAAEKFILNSSLSR
jgi:hypothetical protein